MGGKALRRSPEDTRWMFAVNSHWMSRRAVLLLCFLVALALGGLGSALAQGEQAILAEVDGAINPVTQRFIEGAVKKGESEDAELVIIQLDTPGGLLTSTEKIVETLLRDRVPTVVYVSPRGAFAASAGTFITVAANFAVMAPGTSIGAASPVGGAGEDLPETLSKKVTEAVDALVRSVADVRGRNSEELSRTVRESVAFSAEEAVAKNVVDFIALDVTDLLRQLDGRTMTLVTAEGVEYQHTLHTSDLRIQTVKMNLIERFLFFLADPNVSFLLLSIGGLGIVVELFNPGLIVPAVVGIICLILAFLSLGNLPVNWAGVGLILFAMVLLIAELVVAGFGVLGIGAIVSFVLGSLILFSETGLPAGPSTRVSLWILVPFVTIVFAGGGWVMWTIAQSRKPGQERAVSDLVGQIGEVASDLALRGTVRLQNELWTAVAEGPDSIAAGERVKVLWVEGSVLTVTRIQEEPQEKGSLS